MKYIYLILLFLVILLCYNKYIIYLEDYINEPYITVFAKNGLNNKLQVVLSYLYKAHLENKKLLVYWIVDDECPDIFDNLFEPIKNVTFIYNKSEDESIFDYITYLKYNNDNTYIDKKYYQFLKPKLNIQTKINEWVLKLNNKFIACHIRRTDLHKYHNNKDWWYKPKTDNEYINFINQYDNTYNIFLAADDVETQDTFKDIYGNRVFFKPIIKSNNLRQTSLEDAVIDMFVCSKSIDFLGTHGSSFSDTINYLKNL